MIFSHFLQELQRNSQRLRNPLGEFDEVAALEQFAAQRLRAVDPASIVSHFIISFTAVLTYLFVTYDNVNDLRPSLRIHKAKRTTRNMFHRQKP